MKRWTVRTALISSVFVPTIMVAAAVGRYSHATAQPHLRPAASPASTTASPTPSPPPSTPAGPTQRPSVSTPPAPARPSAEGTPEQQQALAARVAQAVQADVPSAQVGMEVYDRQTGAVVTSLNADQQFAAMSVVKILIAVDVLAQNNWAPPDPDTQQNLHQMLSASDDAIADELWESDGGAAIIARDVALLGLTGTEPPADPEEWGDTRITAQDISTVYRYLTGTAPAADRDLFYSSMANAPKTAADGTDQYFGIPDGLPATTWAVKQGWGTSGSDAVYNTTGLLGPDSRYVVVVLTSAPARYYAELPKALTAGTGQLAGALTSQP